jgi:iron complex outermembrane recepter protein
MVRVALSIGSICVAFLGLLFTPPVHAEQQEDIQVKDVVVTSTRLPDAPVDARTLPAKVTIITAEDVKKSGAKTVQEAIQWATGIVMYDQNGNAFQQKIDLRGFNGQPADATSVFVDGVRMNEPDFNTTNFDLIPFDTIERIEIIPGASAIYGKNAVGGVINIITKRGGDKRQVTGETLFGSFHRERYTMTSSGPLGQFDYYGNFARETESGYRDESAARISRFYGRLGYRPSERTDVTLSYTYVKDRLYQAGQAPLNLAEANPQLNFTPGDFDDKETSVVRVTARQAFSHGFSLNGNAFYRHLDQELFGVGQPFLVGGILSTGTTLGKTESRGGTLQLGHEATPMGYHNQLVIGSEITKNNFSNSLSSLSDFGSFSSRTSSEENIAAVYAQDVFHVTSSLILTTGLRYDRSQITVDSVDSFSSAMGTRTYHRTTPRVGVTYLFNPSFSTYFNYSEGFRIPTSLELFNLNGQPNLDLKPIRSQNYELGAKGQFGDWGSGAVTVYQNISNDIFFTCNTCDPFSPAFDGSNRNTDKARRRGVEATVKAKWNEYVDGTVNYTFTEAQFRSMFNLSATKRVDSGDSFPLVPKHRVGMTINVHPTKGWTLSMTGLYVSSQFYLNDETNSQPRIPDYIVLNARLAYERPVPGGRLSGFLMVNNFTNNHYFTFGSIASNTLTGGGMQDRFVSSAPGVAFYGGLSYRFEGL